MLRRVLVGFLCLYSSGHVNFQHVSNCFEAISKKITKSHGATYWGPRHDGQCALLAQTSTKYIELDRPCFSNHMAHIAVEFSKLPWVKGVEHMFTFVVTQLAKIMGGTSNYATKILGILMVFHHLSGRHLSPNADCIDCLLSSLNLISGVHAPRGVDFELWPETVHKKWKPVNSRDIRPHHSELRRQTTIFILQFSMPPNTRTDLRQQMKEIADRREKCETKTASRSYRYRTWKHFLDLDLEILQLLINDLPDPRMELRGLMANEFALKNEN